MISLIKRHALFICLCVAFAAAAAALIIFWFNSQLNPDAVSYISIAQKYAEGDFKHAINGYWGPLLSILLVPGIWLHIDPIIAAKLLSVIACVVILVTIYHFLMRRKVARSIALASCGALAVTMVGWVTYDPITPDVLMAMMVVIFGTRLVSFTESPSTRNGIFLGAVGGLMYFTKGFGFFLFVGVVGMVALWQWLKVDKNLKQVVRRYLPVGIVFLALSVPFITALSLKYDHFTINNAGTFDHRMFGYHGLRKGNFPPVVMTDGSLPPLAPPNDSAVNAWEDPSYLSEMVPEWNPLGSGEELKFFLGGVIGKNGIAIARYISGPLLVAACAALALGWLHKKQYRREFSLFALIAGLMVAGYCLVLAEGRYVWGAVALGTAAAALWVDMARKKQLVTKMQLVVGGVLLCGLVALQIYPAIEGQKYIDLEWRESASELRAVLPKKTKTIADAFNPSYQLCYHLQLTCYNVLAPTTDFEGYFAHLKSLGITHVINHHTRDSEPLFAQFIEKYLTPIHHTKVGNQPLTIYTLAD